MAMVPFARWRPDNATLNSPYASDIANVLCAEASYIPFPTLQPFSGAVPDQPVGGISVRDSAGTVHIFCGTAGKLYKLDNTTLAWADVSKPATTYSATTEERWQFRVFGNFVVAVNINNAPQVFELNVSATFDDLGGTPPFARHIAVCGSVLMLADSDTVYWSDIDDITVWTGGGGSVAGEQPLLDGGIIQGITDATNPIIGMRQAFWLATFIPGSTQLFAFQKIHDKEGVAAPYSFCTRGDLTFYADSGAFKMINALGQITPIGAEKVDRTVFGAIAGDALASIFGEIDPFYPRVYFAVNVSAETATSFDRLLIYDWQVGEWSQIETQMDILFPISAGTIGYTLEGLAALYPVLEDVPFSLDSRVWQGGAPIMAAFSSNDFTLGFFQGDNAEARIVTQEMGDTAGDVSFCNEYVPIIDCDDFAEIQLSIGARMRRTDVVNWSPEFQPSSNTGVARKNSRARFHRFKMTIAEGATWSHAQGINVNARPAGKR